MLRFLRFSCHISMERAVKVAACVLFGTAAGQQAAGGVAEFAEAFDSSASNWKNSQLGEPNWNATGGVSNSGHLATPFRFNRGGGAGGTSAVLFRAHDEFNASGNAFVGNWVAAGVYQLHAYVRHNAPEPLTFFARIATPFNFPGAQAVQSSAVPSNVWTRLTFLVDPTSPQWVTFEGSNYNTILSNVGHLQFGIEIPPSLALDATSYEIGLDQVSLRVVPEPAGASLLWGVAVTMVAVRRKTTS